jgi:hypothetical protein
MSPTLSIAEPSPRPWKRHRFESGRVVIMSADDRVLYDASGATVEDTAHLLRCVNGAEDDHR